MEPNPDSGQVSFYNKLQDGSYITNPEGKMHSVQKQLVHPNGSWTQIYEIKKDLPIKLAPLQKDERYVIECNGIFELIHFEY